MTILPSCSSHTCTLWRALAVEPSLTTQVLGLLLEKMSRDVPFKESRAFLLSCSPDRVATLLPLAVSGGPVLPSLGFLRGLGKGLHQCWGEDPTGGLGATPQAPGC